MQHAPTLADIVKEETQHGRLIVRFLVSAMHGELQESKPCHRLDAARQLIGIGFENAKDLIPTAQPPAYRRADSYPRTDSYRTENKDPRSELAAMVREETEDGRAAIRFLVDVMQGKLERFKPRHRLHAAKELLRRGFDSPTPQPQSRDEIDWDDELPAERGPAPVNEWEEEEEDGPIEFDTPYQPGEGYRRVNAAARIAKEYFGGEDDPITVAKTEVFFYDFDKKQAAENGTEPPTPYGPLIDPEGNPVDEESYELKALAFECGDSVEAARVAYNAAMRYLHPHLKQYARKKGQNWYSYRPGIASGKLYRPEIPEEDPPPPQKPPNSLTTTRF